MAGPIVQSRGWPCESGLGEVMLQELITVGYSMDQ